VLQAHAAKSKQDMSAFEKYDEPQLKVIVKANKQALGKTFKRQAQSVQDALEQMQVCSAAMTSCHCFHMLVLLNISC
jgi:glycyl-tRNA synthetase (class II)